MKNLFFILFYFLTIFKISCQGLIINEISNGSLGSQEYYELVVIGSTLNPMANVDLGGWIIDDNNGSFEGSSLTGVATGHIRIKPGSLSSVKPGSIIVIYNSSELFFTPDPQDSNSDCVYFIPINDNSLDNNGTIPSTSSINYFPAVYGSTQLWSRIGLANTGDAAQVRRPNGTFYHGFSYGDVSVPFPNFPIEFGGLSSFNILTGSGSSRNYFFNCGNFTSSSNFSRGTAPTNETPGLPNNDFNKYFINSLRIGSFDYSNLNSSSNFGSSSTLVSCDFILPIEIEYFYGEHVNNQNVINWKVQRIEDVSYFELERSSDGIEYEVVYKIYTESDINEFSYTDYEFNTENYYRLKIEEINDDISYSHTIYLENKVDDKVLIYPNPNNGFFSIKNSVQIKQIKLYNYMGQFMFDIEPSVNINLDLDRGHYYLKVNDRFYQINIL